MSQPTQTWDYLTVDAAAAPDLAALGQAGWELVGIAGTGDEQELYFKRQGLDFRERVTLDQKRRYYTLWGHPLPEESS